MFIQLEKLMGLLFMEDNGSEDEDKPLKYKLPRLKLIFTEDML